MIRCTYVSTHHSDLAVRRSGYSRPIYLRSFIPARTLRIHGLLPASVPRGAAEPNPESTLTIPVLYWLRMSTARLVLLGLFSLSILPVSSLVAQEDETPPAPASASAPDPAPTSPSPLTDSEQLTLLRLQRDFEVEHAKVQAARATIAESAPRAAEINRQIQQLALYLQDLHDAQGYNLTRDTLQWVKADEQPTGAQQERADAANRSEPVEPTGP